MTTVRMLSLATLLAVLPDVADAAPRSAGECRCEELPSAEDCAVARAMEIIGEAEAKYDEEDYEGAIELFEKARALLPAEDRDKVLLPLRNAQIAAFRIDDDIEHVREAYLLTKQYIDSCDPDDTEGRDAVEAEFLTIMRDLAGSGFERFDLGDYDGAIESWQRLYDLAPDEHLKASITIPLATAHFRAYSETDQDAQHLREARDLLEQAVGTLEPEYTEEEIQEAQKELDSVKSELARLKAEEEERQAKIIDQRVEQDVEQRIRDLPPPPKRRLPFWVETAGLTTGTGLVAIGVATLSFDEKCRDKSMTITECPGVWETTTEGFTFLAVGTGILLSSTVLLIVDEVRQRRRSRQRQLTILGRRRKRTARGMNRAFDAALHAPQALILAPLRTSQSPR